ncbi:MAG TPA: transcriptional regulator [Nitrosopumilaceae archaeon]|nr:transcriptional regulator [Nitrosopumilaceae archaeon]
MPEIWLNYGKTDIVLDIRAENLDQRLDSEGKSLTDSELSEKLDTLDLTKQMELVILNNSKTVQKTISSIFEKCEQKSIPKPRILADRTILTHVKSFLPEGSTISEFGDENLSNSSLVFVGEMELDGLFGFETIATRLIKKFGNEQMLIAYQQRKGDLPASGETIDNMQIAKKFVDSFEISGIEIIANQNGISDISLGHPSSTMTISKQFGESATKQVEKHRTMMISTGKNTSNDTLRKSLSSLWNCSGAIKDNGLAVLLAECRNGIGSEAIQQFIEGRMSLERLKKPAKYVDGMEDLLFLTEIQKRFQVGLVSILPEFYTKKLNLVSFAGIKRAMDYILKIQGIKQKVAVVSDGARILLR